MPGPTVPPPAARLAVLDRVRAGDHTVNAIAASLGVTDNAVRLHLSALERDGLLRRRGVVHSGQAGQPAAEYALTPTGELALSAAFPPVLTALVGAIGDKLDAREKRALFVDAGRRLASDERSREIGSVASRADACGALLESLGGRVTVAHARGRATIVGTGCPLAGAVRAEPGTCTIIEALLARTSGLKVVQHCDHGEHPACRFELTPD